jgi:hypothetical protein
LSAVAEPVGTVKKAGAFLRRLFSSSLWKIIKKKPPKATLFDFHSLRQFQQAFFPFWVLFSFFVKVSRKNRATFAYRPRSAIALIWNIAEFTRAWAELRTRHRADAILP